MLGQGKELCFIFHLAESLKPMSSIDLHRDSTKSDPKTSRFQGQVPKTLLDLLRWRAWDFADQCAYRFLHEDGTHRELSFQELDRRARALARRLQALVEPRQRVLLMFPPGLEFIEAFFACLYAGVLAVPTSPPKRRDLASRVSTLVEDCDARVGLTNAWGNDVLMGVDGSARLDKLPWLTVESLADAAADEWEPPEVGPADLAFLQYTSGSTERPRGVMISHGNLIHNLEMIYRGFGLSHGTPDNPAGVGVSWLPVYHDMGLIGGVLASLWVGGTSVLMAPSAFLQRPERWLRAISDYGASVSGAPNFAYELCVRKIDGDALVSLDLSRWRVAFCGAEPIRPETVGRFAEKFGRCGFRKDAFYPCFGLAEATLLVTGNKGPRVPTVRSFRRSKLQTDGIAELDDGRSGDARTLVGCGETHFDQSVKIVNPLTKTPCAEDTVGEIWVQGPSVALGYWGQERPNEEFDAALADGSAGRYLRTGDLGFLHDGELFVTGRIKELLIIRGRNLDPTDIEFTAQRAHPALLPDSGAAFSQVVEGAERLVLVNELDRAHRKADFDQVFRAVRRAIVDEHGVDPHALVLIRSASLPRTTSGKVRRTATGDLHTKGQLTSIAEWSKVRPRQGAENQAAQSDRAAQSSRGPAGATENGRRAEQLAEQIEGQILHWLRDRVGVPPEELDRERPFAELGVDSLAAVELSCNLENWLKVKLSPMTAWQYPTPAAIARHLAVASLNANLEEAPSGNVGAARRAEGLEGLRESFDHRNDAKAAELLDKGGASHDRV